MNADELAYIARTANREHLPEAYQLALEEMKNAAELGETSCCPSLDCSLQVAENVCYMLRDRGYDAYPLPHFTPASPNGSIGGRQISVSWKHWRKPQPKPTIKQPNEKSWIYRIKMWWKRNIENG